MKTKSRIFEESKRVSKIGIVSKKCISVDKSVGVMGARL